MLASSIDLASADLAQKYRVIVPTAALDNYSEDHLCKMFSASLLKDVGAAPSGYDVLRFYDPPVTHIYPMYDGEYLYLSKTLLKLVHFEPISCMGYVPFCTNSRCWQDMRVDKPVYWDGVAILRSEDVQYSLGDVELTYASVSARKRMEVREQRVREDASVFERERVSASTDLLVSSVQNEAPSAVAEERIYSIDPGVESSSSPFRESPSSEEDEDYDW